MNNELTITINSTDTSNILGKPHKVILFNDDNHNMAEVVIAIMEAIKCDPQKAMAIMMEAHTTGRAIVFTGSLERCEMVESALSAIQLGTKIEPA